MTFDNDDMDSSEGHVPLLLILSSKLSCFLFVCFLFCFFRENHVSNHVVGRTDQLPQELIVKSEGTEIFSQELPRVGVVVIIVVVRAQNNHISHQFP